MINTIIQAAVRNKLITGIFTLLFIGVGIFYITRLSVDALPDVTNNQVLVITSCPTLATQEVEKFITIPIETQMKSIPEVQEIRSISRSGLSSVTVVFKDHVPIHIARQQISERLKMAEEDLPKQFGSPEIVPPTTGLGEIYQYTLHPRKGYEGKFSPMDLRTIQDWIIRRQLLGVPGVVDVSTMGGYLKQYEVAVAPEKLVSMHITLIDVFDALSKNNGNTGGSYIEKGSNIYFIRGEGLIGDTKDIENVVVKNVDGMPVKVRDIAAVQLGYAPRFGAMTRNGEGETVGAVVLMLKGENSVEVIKSVKARMEEIRKNLPEDVVIEPFLDRSELIGRTIKTVSRNLIEGALIVIFVLVLFLGNFRAGLIVASVIPLAMLFAIIMMNIFGVTANLMSMGALDFGLIVDGAVIIVESMLHILSEKHGNYKLSQEEMDNEVIVSSGKIMSSAVFGQIIILIVYVPIFALVGIEGKMFKPMAQTVSFAIIGALLLSLTYVPLMSSIFLSKRTEVKESFSDRFIRLVQRHYTLMLERILKHRLIVVTISVMLFIGAIFLFNSLGGEFLPEMDEGDYQVNFSMRQGTNLPEMITTSNALEKILIDSFPEVKQVVAKIGTSEVPTDPMPIHNCDINIILEKDRSKWVSAKNKEDLAERMNQVLAVIPGKNLIFEQPIQMRVNEMIAGVRGDLAIKIFGEDLDMLYEKANDVSRIISKVPGVADVKVEQVVGMPQLVVKYNRDRIAQYGLSIEDCNTILNTALAGGKAGSVYEGEKKFDLRVRLANYRDADEDKVKNIFVPLPNGTQIPISQIAEVSFQSAPSQISREGAARRIVIQANAKGRDIESIVKEVQQKLDAGLKLPSGYYVTYGGSFQNLQEAKGRLSVAVPIALFLIFLLLFFSFRSIKESLIVYSAIPLATIGGVAALWVRGMTFSISAGIGFIALFGVAVLNGIVLIAYFNRLEQEGVTDVTERVLKGTATRLRPVLATAAVASLGFLPMAVSTSAGSEVQKPLATVVIGGLISSTLLTLIVLPVLYSLFTGNRNKGSNLKSVVVSGMVLTLMLSSAYSQAQTPKRITISEAITLATTNSLQIKSQQLNVLSSRHLQKSFFELPKTEIGFQYGQYNSIQLDNGFTVQQAIPFPTYFGAQKGVYNASLKSAELLQQTTTNEVVAQVRMYSYRILHLQQSQDELKNLDSLYNSFVKAASKRYSSGETNLLEKTTAEAKRGEINLMLKQNETELKTTYLSLKAIVSLQEDFILIDSQSSPLSLATILDTSTLSNNPLIKYYYQQAVIADNNKRLEVSQALPDFRLGYLNQTIIGTQNVNGSDVFYNAGKRFMGFNVGIGVPLTFLSNAERVKSLDLKRQSLQVEADQQKRSMLVQVQNAFADYSQNLAQYEYFNKSAIPNSVAIIDAAGKSFKQGDIGYVEYVQALQTATSIRLNYLESIERLNQSVVTIQLLTNK
ncbi:MAG: CusA/CzcA family heavy metal efflux RND transporter [Bacteroidetes bacterium]|nr:CusA/CzcA family heavy metal efflux RND transporter [Bacteroidota bacterium]